MELLGAIGQWSGFVLWGLLLVAASLFVYLGLGGTFIIIGLAAVHGAVTGFDPITWQWLLIFLGLALLGELIEFVVGTFYVAQKGATKGGVTLAFVGGLVGAFVGNSIVPVIGAVLGSFVGAFCGAVYGQYRHNRSLEPSLRVGAHALVGRVVAMLIKHAIALVMVGFILRLTAP
ncbi:MAG: hypothetical protein ACI9UK_000101 [Candidatus Krumholzibacteriia bacterium]